MARRAFDMIDVVEILQHWHAGRPKAGGRSQCGGGPEDGPQVRGAGGGGRARAGRPAVVAGRSGRRWCAGWFPELVDAKARSLTWPLIDAHRERIDAMLATNTVTTVHQRLRDEHGLAVSDRSFRRYVWLEFPDRRRRATVTVLRPPVAPGEEAQIDYGYPGLVAGPGRRAGAAGVGVRDGAGLFPAHVRAAGAADGPARLGGRARGRVRVLRRCARPGWCRTT